ncbi:MAG TPA: hypothetical protein VFQ38_03265 [Longimicrobiales bacterium]|nr:hypothetical protein [Longimicrobiales bacterium]
MGPRTHAVFGSTILALALALLLAPAGAAAQTRGTEPTALRRAAAPAPPLGTPDAPALAAAAAPAPDAVPAKAPAPGREADRLGPTAPDARLLAPAAAEAPRPEPTLSRAASHGEGIPLMAAGGALFVAGAIIGGDAGTLLMVGGAGIGAYGIYIYLR